jgi:chaperonin GroEL (HSP60 family)
LINPKVIVFDGYIENVSEIHHLLEKSFEAKEQVLLFHRGISADVLNTLVQNWKRGTLRIIPIQVPFDLEGINQINDIAIVCKSDLISSLKGDLLTSVKYECLSNIDQAITSNNAITILNETSSLDVKLHRNNLYKKRLESHEDVQKYIDVRIKSLSPGLVTCYIPDQFDFFQKKQNIDRVLRAYRCLLNHGTIIINNDKLLTTTAISILKYVPIIETSLKSLGAIVVA